MQNIEPFFTYSSSEKISPINCLRFNNSGSLLASGSDKKVNLFNISDDLINLIVNFDSSINNILSIAFNPSGNILAVGSEDNIRLYNISVEKKAITNIAIPEGKFENVSSISFDSTGNYLAFTSEYNSILFWKISYNLSGIMIDQIANFQEVGNLFSSIMFQPETNPPLLVASSHSNLKYFQLLQDSEVENISSHQVSIGSINSIDFHSIANPTLLALVTDNELKLFDCSNPSKITELASVKEVFSGHLSRCISVAFHPSELFLVTGYWNNTAKLWSISPDFRSINPIANLSRGVQESGVHVAFHPRKNPLLIATGGTYHDTTIKFFSFQNQSAGYKNKNNESRFFKLVSENGKEVDGGRYELPAKTKSGKQQTRGPKDKASTAFSEICKKNNKKGECSYKFAIQETTRGSNKKIYHYEGKRVKLANPIVLELKDKKTGEVKKVVKKYKNVIISIN